MPAEVPVLAAEVPEVPAAAGVMALGINTLVFRNTLGKPLYNGTLSNSRRTCSRLGPKIDSSVLGEVDIAMFKEGWHPSSFCLGKLRCFTFVH